MTREDRTLFFTALGFLAVVVRDVPQGKQADRALAVARLMENFCTAALAEKDNVLSKDRMTDLLSNERAQRAMEELESCLAPDSVS